MAKGHGALDGAIQTILYVCFAIYILMGIALLTMGGIYAGDVGAVSTTATSMLIIGVFMLLLGAVAMFANYGQNWLLLCIIECINVALFVVLTATMVIATLFAMGYQDPVSDLIDRNWREISDGEGKGYNANPKSVCFRYVNSCDQFGKNYDQIAPKTNVGCRRTVADELTADSRDGLFATAFSSNDTTDTSFNCNFANSDGWTGCTLMSSSCSTCMSACKTYLIREAKSGSEAAAAFVLLTVFFTVVTCVWNNFLTLAGNDEFGGITQMVGIALNAIVTLVGLAMTIMCIIRLSTAQGYTTLLVLCMLLGIFLLLCGGAVAYGVQTNNAGLMNIGNIFLGIFGYAMLVMGVALAVCTGVFMEEANSNYDQNYNKIRTAVEKYDPSFCKIPLADCKKITTKASGYNNVLIVAGNTAKHDSDALWDAQFLAIQSHTNWVSLTYPSNSASQRNCISTAVCVACKPLISDTIGLKKCGKNPSPVNINDQGYYDCVDLTAVLTKLNEYEKASPQGGQAVEGNMTGRDEYMLNVSLKWRNRTKFGPDRTTRRNVGKCEKALDDWSADTDEKTGTCMKNQNCTACDTMLFTEGANFASSGANKSRCIRAMMSVINNAGCNPTAKSTACRANFVIAGSTTSSIANTNFDSFANKMTDSFCQYTDDACQTKLKQKTEDELSTLSVLGIIFCVVYMFILYATLRGVVTFKGGDDE